MAEYDGAGRRLYANYSTIDWLHDMAKERRRMQHLLGRTDWRGRVLRALDASHAWVLVSMVGCAAGLFAASIDIAAEWLNDLKHGYCSSAWYLNMKFCCWHASSACPEWKSYATDNTGHDDSNDAATFFSAYAIYIIIACLLATTSALLIKTFAPYAAGSGIPEVKTILGGFVIRKFLGVWTLIIKSVGLALSVASGLNLGKEGPLVHVACCLGNIFPRFFSKYANNEAKKREILSAASAAGVSVAFGAPIGGVLFSLEEVSYYFPYKTMWRAFFCAMIAAVTLQLMNPFRTNQLVLFQVTYNRPWHAFELPFFMILGAFGGLYGSFFIHMNLKLNAWRKSCFVKRFPVFEVLFITFLTAVISYPNVYTRMNTSELVADLLQECHPDSSAEFCDKIAGLLVLATVVKAVMTILTFGIKVPAGIFVPSMAVGACVGRLIGISVQSLHEAYPDSSFFASCPKGATMPCISPGTYAMVGAASTLGGVTRMTVSLVVIMFELTGALTYVLPIMLAVMVSKWVGDAFDQEGIYDGLIRLNGYPFLNSKKEYIYSTVANEIMTTVDKIATIPADDFTLQQLEKLLQDHDVKGFPIVSNKEERLLVGFIGRPELLYVLTQARTNQKITPTTPCLFIPLSGFTNTRDSDAFTLSNRRLVPGTVSDEEAQIFTRSNTPLPQDMIDFSSFVDYTPISLSTRFPVEIVLELFKKMGLRYVLITTDGCLSGVITKKDLLRHIAEVEERKEYTGVARSEDQIRG